MTTGPTPRAGAASRPHSFGPVVAALIVSVTIFSLAAALALDGVPNTENGLFYAMGEVAGIDLPEVVVVSRGWLLVARVAGLAMLISLVGVFVVRKRIGRSGRSG